ncbi:MAG: hypothetical protein JWP26_4404 [Devosia sp.]|uniref:hypothetical protein n=1 Tax=Devosia sp. TaxID=1871048 RepID=UPI00261CDD16|nr:hypothetical protein [Devosia sp.]MDB5537537.1 hypothetical protein [Devosia sp.]MDB5589434.1 hypothetical protein [Devosia sp.]
MLIWSAIGLLAVTLFGLGAIVMLDVRAKGWANWLDTVHEWQSTIGTVAGFLSAAGVLVLGTAIQDNAERTRSLTASRAIGMGLALETERMANPLQTGRLIGGNIDMQGNDLPNKCLNYVHTMESILTPDTPVYNAVLSQMVDFGDANLALFVRFFSFYVDFRSNLTQIDKQICDAAPADQINYIMHQLNGGLSFYEIIARNYDVTPIIDPALIRSNAGLPPAEPK